MSWIIIGLNWTVFLKCLEMTFVVVWRFINEFSLFVLNLFISEQPGFVAAAENRMSEWISEVWTLSLR